MKRSREVSPVRMGARPVAYETHENGGRFMNLYNTITFYIRETAANLRDFEPSGKIVEMRCATRSQKTCKMLQFAAASVSCSVKLPTRFLNWCVANYEKLNLHWEVVNHQAGSMKNNGGTYTKQCFGKGSKVPATWLSCVRSGVVPDKSMDDWWKFECSHRCLNCGYGDERHDLYCVSAGHLYWESKKSNQSRGHMRKHCFKKEKYGLKIGKCLCRVYKFHKPHCL